MLELNSIAVDPQLAKTGVWAKYMGGEFLLARKGPEYQARLVELYNADKELIESKTPEGDAKSLEIFQQTFCETVILDWKGITRDGVKLEYSPEEALKIVTDPTMYELVTFLEGFSVTHTNYQVKVEAEVAEEVKGTAAS
jgi:hypothetical protein